MIFPDCLTRIVDQLAKSMADAVRIDAARMSAARQMEAAGMTWLRFTAIDAAAATPALPDGFYVEGWKVEPSDKEAIPPLEKTWSRWQEHRADAEDERWLKAWSEGMKGNETMPRSNIPDSRKPR